MPVQELVRKSNEYFLALTRSLKTLENVQLKGFAPLDSHAKKLEFQNLGWQSWRNF